MNSVQIARDELALLWSHRRVRAATAVVVLVPLLYGALYLWAFWDPYSQLDKLPVALVNEDRPVVHDGETVSAGADLVDTLLEDGTLGWEQVSADAARSGLADGTYYLALTVPADFSASLATADSDDPVPARLEAAAHESANLLAPQIGGRVFSEIRSAAAESASEGYLDSMLLGFSDIGGEITDASLGADELTDGLRDARAGATALAEGAATAHAGSRALASGTEKLAVGAGQLDAGAAALAKGSDTLANGLSAAQNGASDLAGGLTDAHAASAQLSGGAQQLEAGIAQATPALAAAASGAASVRDGSAVVVSALEAYAQEHADAADDPGFAQALGAAKQTSAGAIELAGGMQTAGAMLPSLSDGATRLAAGTAQLESGLRTLESGASRLSAGVSDASDGATAIDSGARSLATGTDALASGATQAATGADDLARGVARLGSGAKALAAGLAPAVTGAADLATGLSDGAKNIPAYDVVSREEHASVMARPVELTTERIDPVANYGSGFAPYFIPLSLWVGALIVFFIMSPIPAGATAKRRPPVAVALGGFCSASLVTAAQTLLLLVVLHFGLGLDPVNPLALIGVALLTALTFTAMIQALSGAFGTVGKFVSMVILMLQLTSAAGSFPLQMIPGFFQAIHPYLPMTYVVNALREAISGGDMATLARSALTLLAFAAGSLAVSTVAARRARGWDPARLEPTLTL